MKNKRILLPIIILAVLTVILAVINIANAPEVAEGDLLIVANGKEISVRVASENLKPVIGTLVNGKGDQIPVDGKGLPLRDVLALTNIHTFETVTVTARDEYGAQISAAELLEEGKCYLLIEPDSSIRLVVFGDSNSKRNVTDVIKLTVS